MKQSNTFDYCVVQADGAGLRKEGAELLEEAVRKKVEEGWEPFGNLIAACSSIKTCFYQPMVMKPISSRRWVSNKEIRDAVTADIQQYLTDSLTPGRSYATPIGHVRELIDSMGGGTEHV